MKRILCSTFFLVAFTLSAQSFDFQGLWECPISNDIEDTEYLWIIPIDSTTYYVSYCAPTSHDNDGNTHILDYNANGVIQEDGYLFIDAGENVFYLIPEGNSINEFWNGINYDSDRFFTRVSIDLSEVITADISHQVFDNINKQYR